MNTGDPSFGEENSQSYCSDSSSIPSSLSDCEGVPLQDLQFSVGSQSFSDKLKWFIAHDKAAQQSPEDGNNVPLPSGAPLNQSAADKSASFGNHTTQTVESLLPATSTSGSGQIELGKNISERKDAWEPSVAMSRTLPAKVRDRTQSSLLTHLPAAPFEPGTSTADSTGVHTKDVPSASSGVASGDTSTDRGSKGAEHKETLADNSRQPVPVSSSASPVEPSGSQGSLPATSKAVAGYCSTEDESESRHHSRQPHLTQPSQTAFPIPPLPEQADSLMRHIDTLSMPTVSPDSGIFASSPSGNDSPGSVTSVTAGETTGEQQQPSSQGQPQVQLNEERDQKQQQEPVHLPPPSAPLPPAISSEDQRAAGESAETRKDGVACSTAVSVPDDVEADKYFEDAIVTEIPSPFRGPSIGRKKRGRQPKRNKSQMLQHKKSTLYSGLYTSDGASHAATVPVDKGQCGQPEAAVEDSSTVCAETEQTVKAEKMSKPETVDLDTESSKNADSVDHRKCSDVNDRATLDGVKEVTPSGSADTAADSKPDAPPARRRGPGRPKGSKNKRFLCVVKNRQWKKKLAKGLISPAAVETVHKQKKEPVSSRKRKTAIDEPVAQTSVVKKTGCGKVRKASKGQSLKSPNPSKVEPVPRRKRGRSPKQPVPEDVSAPEVKEKKSGEGSKAVSSSASVGRETGVRGRQFLADKSKAEADSELASLIQSVQNSIQSQFAAQDIDESSEFAMDTNNDFSGIEPSLPRAGEKSPAVKSKSPATKVAKKSATKKPKVHVMMRRTKRRKKKRVQKEQPKAVTPTPEVPEPAKSPEPQPDTSFQDLSDTQTNIMNTGNLFGPITSKPIGFFHRYPSSRILKQSSFRLHSSALGSALSKTGEDSSDDDREGSEGRKKKKKKKLLYFKSKHKNIVDPAFVAELSSLESSMKGMTISEQAYIRVKPGEVPLPSIFKLNIIDVKKKKKDKLVLEPPPAPEKSKKAKPRKDSKEREPPMPELVKEKAKNVRKKSLSEDNHPPSLEIQVARDQCLPPKKRHRMMYEAESTEAVSPKETSVPEKRKVGRPRKTPASESSSTNDRPAPADKKIDCSKPGSDKPAMPSSSTRLSHKKTCHHSEGINTQINEDTLLIPSSQSTGLLPVLSCPRHAHHKSAADAASCAECTLLAESRPQTVSPKSHSRQQNVQDNTTHENRTSKSKTLIRKQKLTVTHCKRKGSSSSSESRSGKILISPSTSPRSRTKMIAAALPSAEVVINPLPESAVSAVVNSQSAKKSLQLQCNTSSDCSNSGAEDESVIRSVCSDLEPLPEEHCLKRKRSDPDATSRGKRRLRDDSSGCEDSSLQSPSDEVKQCSDDSQPPRKRYQRVGLFSDFYKDDEPKKRNESMVRSQPKMSHKGDTSQSLLPPPIHFGKHLREMVIPFQLPYDIWWLFTHDMLRKKEEPRPKFKRIRSNVYVDVKPNTRKFEPHPCNCKRPSNETEKGCLEDCLNRLVFTECTPETCPCAGQCSNQRIQNQEWAPAVEKFLTQDRGYGVRTLEPISSDQIIMEYLGEVVSEQEFRRRMTEEYAQDSHHYCLNMDGRTVIDGYRMGNLTRFVNHACEPNCEMQKWNVNGLYHMVLRTLREIKPYEEITYDYNFHSFNMEAQQVCRCGSSECRGVIGGKFQRNGQVGPPLLRSTRASTTVPPPPPPPPPSSPPPPPPPPVGSVKSHLSKHLSCAGSITRAQEKKQNQPVEGLSRLVSPSSMKPMSQRERLYARKHAIFLVRNIDRARGDRLHGEDGSQEKTEEQATLEKVPNLLSMKDSMNDNRSVRTRLVSLAEENPELQRRHRLAVIFNNVYNSVASYRDEDGSIIATPLMVLPSRKRYPDYYRAITDPIDLTTIRNNIKRGVYNDIHTFDADFSRLFTNVETYCGKKSDMGRVIGRLRRAYQLACSEAVPQVEEVTGEGVTALSSASPSENDSTEDVDTKVHPVAEDEEEDIIRCICGVYRDEGVMIQCEQCFIWQHCDCVKVKATDAEREDLRYRCELCDPRPVEKEILDPQKKDQPGPNGEKCDQYLTLMRDDLQIAQGDCVYLMRDFKRPARSSLRLVAFTSPDKMDIFRVEDLFKNSKGERFATGNMYLRPHETFHEPNRKFFHNELFRYPQYETYPLEQVAGKCMVMDLNTYCKGKPKGFDARDIYVCEYRVDKTARLFTKIAKKFPINTKSFCFDKYPQRLCPKRTYVPHEVPEEYLRRYHGEKQSTDGQSSRKSSSSSAPSSSEDGCKMEGRPEDRGSKAEGRGETKTEVNDLKKVKVDKKDVVQQLKKEDKKNAKKERLNNFMLKLLATHSGKQKVDLTYLLEESLGKRPRKKTAAFS